MSASYEKGENEELKVNVESPKHRLYRRPTEKEVKDCRPCRLCIVASFIILLVGLLVASIVLIALTDKCKKEIPQPEEDSSFSYQINVKLFADSNGDGVGDLNGTLNRLEYIRQLGVNKIVLNGIISPNHKLTQGIGTINDLKNLTKTFKKNNIKVLVNFQPITVSSTHEWFLQSKNGTSKRNWFIWLPKNRTNNWLASNGASAWHTIDNSPKESYYSYFGKDYPTLNYNNAEVVEQMIDIMKMWMDYGINGFYLQMVSRLVIDQELKNNTALDIYDEGTKQSHNVLEKFYKAISQKDGFLSVSPNTKRENMLKYLGSREHRQSDVVFNDDFATMTTIDVQALNHTLRGMEQSSFGSIGWLVGGSGYNRLADRIKNVDEAKTVVLFTLLLPKSVLMPSGDEALFTASQNNSLMPKPVAGFINLTEIRSSLDALKYFPQTIYAENKSILLLYNNEILVGANFAGVPQTIKNLSMTKNGKYLFSTNSSNVDKKVDLSKDFQLDGYGVQLIKLLP